MGLEPPTLTLTHLQRQNQKRPKFSNSQMSLYVGFYSKNIKLIPNYIKH